MNLRESSFAFRKFSVCDIRDGVGRRTDLEECTLVEYAVLGGSMKAPAEHASSSRASKASVDMVVQVRLRAPCSCQCG
jgi:hypothetical protein